MGAARRLGPLDDAPARRGPAAALRRPAGAAVLAIAAAVVFVVVERRMGRLPWCSCGFGIWTGEAWSARTSQDLADPYSFTHVIHGIALYGLLRLVAGRWPVRQRALAALLLEAGWELLENSPPVIALYRAVTASVGYVGDSILNSGGDVLFCLAGFWLAWRLPPRMTVALVALIEVALLVAIRDNLTLNVLMLLHPVPAVKAWQLGG